MSETNSQTHFGYQKVPETEKAGRVRGVFDSVADQYDVMNDLMSMGIHRLWKRFTLGMTGLSAGQAALDIAAGTGDLSIGLSRQVGPSGQVVMTDINAAMLSVGRDRVIDQGVVGNLDFVQCDAESLPFPDNSFDCVTVGFGLRNFTHKELGLAEMTRVLKPGGRVLVLEFSKPNNWPLRKLYDAYSFSVLPKLGSAIAKDADSYQYLAESIRMHPGQQVLLEMMQSVGLERCDYHNLSCGIVALHRGYKF